MLFCLFLLSNLNIFLLIFGSKFPSPPSAKTCLFKHVSDTSILASNENSLRNILAWQIAIGTHPKQPCSYLTSVHCGLPFSHARQRDLRSFGQSVFGQSQFLSKREGTRRNSEGNLQLSTIATLSSHSSILALK